MAALQLFNRGPRRKHTIARPKPRPSTEHVGNLNDFNVLDPGFEDCGIHLHDFEVAPGLNAHFATMENPPPGYYSLPILERARID